MGRVVLEKASSSAGQEIPCIFWNPKSSPLALILSQMNPTYAYVFVSGFLPRNSTCLAFSLEGARLRIASRWVAVIGLSRLVYGLWLTKILVPGQSMSDLWWGESVTASSLLHIRVIRKMDSGHIRGGTCVRHVVSTVGILETALPRDT